MRQKAGRMSITLGTLDPLRTWVAAEAERRGITPTAVVKEAIDLAREYLEAMEGVRSRLEAVALLEGKTRRELVGEFLRKSTFAALDKGRKK